jgi:hypothetical protein
MKMTEMTISDDILILYYYKDGLSETQRSQLQAAMRQDVAMRARYEQLRADLDDLDRQEAVLPAPDAVARWHDGIDRAARMEQQRAIPRSRTSLPRSFTWGAALAATLVVGIGIGNYLSGRGALEPPINDYVAGNVDPVSGSASATFARGLAVHLRESRQELANLPAEPGSERTLLLSQMIQQNRMFERAAAEKDAEDIARVLRALEPILMQLASADLSPAEASALQAQLAFELNVVLTKYGQNASDETGPI